MDFDQTKKIEVEVSENVSAENEVHARPVHGVRKKRNFAALKKVDILDVALVPVIVGVFVSLGFLFAGLFRATSAADAVAEIGNIVAAVL